MVKSWCFDAKIANNRILPDKNAYYIRLREIVGHLLRQGSLLGRMRQMRFSVIW